MFSQMCSLYSQVGRPQSIHLKRQSALHILLKRFGDGLVESAKDLHRELGVDALTLNKVVERVRQSEADTASVGSG